MNFIEVNAKIIAISEQPCHQNQSRVPRCVAMARAWQVLCIHTWIFVGSHRQKHCTPMVGKKRRLVADEPVEFEVEPVEVRDFRKFTDHFGGIYRIYLK